jgi:hypothetical protein
VFRVKVTSWVPDRIEMPKHAFGPPETATNARKVGERSAPIDDDRVGLRPRRLVAHDQRARVP